MDAQLVSIVLYGGFAKKEYSLGAFRLSFGPASLGGLCTPGLPQGASIPNVVDRLPRRQIPAGVATRLFSRT